MPPLRDRQEDIPLLANYFAAKYGEKCNRRITGISPEAQARLRSYDWPGNVRELENAIERAVVLGTTDHILLEDLPESAFGNRAAGNRARPRSIMRQWPKRRSRSFLTRCSRRREVILKPQNCSACIQTICIA